jgi:ATP-binding protein involved in chromosome partitioning
VRAAGANKRLPGVKNILAVGSGKGGVGKSTVAVNLAYALQAAGAKVGLLDADIQGPSLGVMLGLKGSPEVKDSRLKPVQAYGMPVMSFAFFAPVGEAVLLRGAQTGKALEQFLTDVAWPELDYLVVDLPPGTGDVPVSLFHTVGISGAVVVSTPQDVALADAVKGVAMFRKMKVPVLGLVENMSGFVCPHCSKTTAIFGQGGVEKNAAEKGVPFLGSIPLDPLVVQRGDSGIPLVVENPASPVSKALVHIAGQVAHRLSLCRQDDVPEEASA